MKPAEDPRRGRSAEKQKRECSDPGRFRRRIARSDRRRVDGLRRHGLHEMDAGAAGPCATAREDSCHTDWSHGSRACILSPARSSRLRVCWMALMRIGSCAGTVCPAPSPWENWKAPRWMARRKSYGRKNRKLAKAEWIIGEPFVRHPCKTR